MPNTIEPTPSDLSYNLQSVRSKIQAKPGISRAGLIRAVDHRIKARELDSLTARLEDSGEIHVEHVPTAGRPRRQYWPGPRQTQQDGITAALDTHGPGSQPITAKRFYEVWRRLLSIGVNLTDHQLHWVLA
jgi:hypothetical protein